MFIETSALSNNNVRDAFEILLQEIYNQRQKMPQSKPFNPLKLDGTTDPGQPTKSGCC
jgi:GTPase SAR1 family protein